MKKKVRKSINSCVNPLIDLKIWSRSLDFYQIMANYDNDIKIHEMRTTIL